MKTLLILLALVCSTASAQWMAPGLITGTPIGANGIGRQDAQLEVRNDNQQGHALISIMQMANPGQAGRQAGISFQGYDTTGLVRQFGSVSYDWVGSAALGSGFAALRFQVNTVAGSGEVPLRLWGGQQGAVFFGYSGIPGDNDTAGGPFVRINRSPGHPSLVGQSDLYLEGKHNGSGEIGLNVAGGGTVYLGGPLRFIGNSGMSSACPASVPANTPHCIKFTASDGQTSYIPTYR